MTRLIFVRHGESEANNYHVFSGHSDYKLTTVGEHQAKLVAEYISQNEKPEKVYASPLSRALITGNTVAEKCEIPLITNRNLKEIFGGKWENVEFDKLQDIYKDEYNLWITNIGLSCPVEGESLFELTERCLKAVNEIVKENPDSCLVIATHATVIRVLFAHWKGLSLQDLLILPWAFNASVSTVDIDEDLNPHNIEYNIYKFLGDNITQLPSNV